MKKIVLSIVLLSILSLFGWQIGRQVMSAGSGGPRRHGPRPTAVEIEPVGRQTIRDLGHFTGSLYPKAKFIVAPKTSGRLERLRVDIGDDVHADTLIAELENDEYRQQVDQAKAELKVARANLEENRITTQSAARELERVKRLRASRIASEAELEAALAQYQAQAAKNKIALAQVDQKTAGLKTTQARLAYTRIRLPDADNNVQWVVGERFVDEGAMLAAGSPIVSILNICELIAVIHVIDRDYPKIRVGQPAVITADAYPGRIFHGRIARLAPELKESSREARVEVAIPNPDLALKPGMFVRVQIEYGSRPQVVTVPISALVKRKGRQGVFLADRENRIARFIPLQIGIISGEQAEVIEPVLEGYVVTLGQHLLEDGGSILPHAVEEKGADSPSMPSSLP